MKKRKKARTDLIAGIVLALFSIFYFHFAGEIKIFAGAGSSISARTIPYMWAALLFLLSICLIFRDLRRPGEAVENIPEGETRDFRWWLSENYAVVGTFAALILYALLLKRLGYMLSTFLYLMVQIMLLTEKARFNGKTFLRGLLIAVLFTLISDYLFVRLLHVPLPKGLFGF